MQPNRKVKKTKRVIYWDRVAAVAIMPILAVTLIRAAFPTNIVEYEEREVIVKSGDTMWSIAKDAVGEKEDVRKVIYHMMKDNNLPDANIHPGMKLKVRAIK